MASKVKKKKFQNSIENLKQKSFILKMKSKKNFKYKQIKSIKFLISKKKILKFQIRGANDKKQVYLFWTYIKIHEFLGECSTVVIYLPMG